MTNLGHPSPQPILSLPLGPLGQSLDLQLLGSLQEGRQLLLEEGGGQHGTQQNYTEDISIQLPSLRENFYLCDIDLPSVHELQDCCEVGEGHVLQDDDRVLGRVLLQQVLEVGRAGAEDHLVGLSVLALKTQKSFNGGLTKERNNQVDISKYLGGDRDVTEALLVPEVFEGGDHVGLEVVPSEAELLVVRHPGLKLAGL